MSRQEFAYSYVTSTDQISSNHSKLSIEEVEHGNSTTSSLLTTLGYVAEDTQPVRINLNVGFTRNVTIERDDAALGYTDTCSQDQSQDDSRPTLPTPIKKKAWSSTAGNY
jgi:hypothetical protein